MPLVTVQELIDCGVHFGHQASRWNPKMKPYILGKRHRIHVIDLQQTIRGLYQACHFLREMASTGTQVLFLGTKRQIRTVIQAEAARCGMPAVTERWIGGTLTNFNTVRERLQRLEELETMESDGSMERFKKKNQASLRREMRKIRRNLQGIRDLHGLPGAIVVVDPRREDNCVREAARMNVPVVCILDTDCDPDRADIVIPANDDAMSSVQLLLSKLVDALVEGRANMGEEAYMEAQQRAQSDLRAREAPGRSAGRGGPRGGPRRGPRQQPLGGRLGRQSTGRFADRRAGHAASISFGKDEGTPDATGEQPTGAAAAPAEAPSEGPSGTLPGGETSTPPGAPAAEPVVPAVAPEPEKLPEPEATTGKSEEDSGSTGDQEKKPD